MTIKQATVEDTGIYACYLDNFVQPVVSYKFSLVVEGEPFSSPKIHFYYLKSITPSKMSSQPRFFQRESDWNFAEINPKWAHFSSGNFYKSTRTSYRQAKSSLVAWSRGRVRIASIVLWRFHSHTINIVFSVLCRSTLALRWLQDEIWLQSMVSS